MADGRILRIYRDGRRTIATKNLQLPVGAQANKQTLAEMRKIIREDSQYPDLKNFIYRDILKIENKSSDEQIKKAFEFCRDEIVFAQEENGYETLADFWSCRYTLGSKGDCAIKCVSLGTALSFIGGFKQLYLTAIRQLPNVESFNHVYIIRENEKGYTAFDPTPTDFQIGQAQRGYETLMFPIF